MIKSLKKSPKINLEQGYYSGFQIETESYIFDFDLFIQDLYTIDFGTAHAPETVSIESRDVSINNLTIWSKQQEEFKNSNNDKIEEIIINKFQL